MGDTIITVENLGKRYTIAHEKQEPYTALRDVVSRKVKNLFRSNGTLTKEEFWALKDLSFDIRQGESVGIIGRNGAGKSTLLKILSQITEPTEGRIEINGRIASLLEVGTGFHPELTGRENIFLNGAILGMSQAEIRRKFDEIVDFSGVEKFLDTPVKRFSSGMYVRLAFAIAAFLEPEILVVDEVLAVGDAEFQKKCLGKMDEVSKKEGRTVLFVSHNMGTVLQLCSRCILLKQGRIEAIGRTPSIVERYYSYEKGQSYFKEKSDADIYFKQVFACDGNGNPQTNFGHKEDIRLRLIIAVKHFFDFQNIGICLLRQDKSRVFTVNKSLRPFYRAGKEEITVDFIIRGSLIAPMDYSFLAALNTKSGDVTYDYLSDICPIRVYDDGTDLAFAEGMDYGCVIIEDQWELIN